MIIGIIGRKRSGKDEVAKTIASQYDFTKYAFADPIKEICRIAFLWDDEMDEIGDHKEEIDEFWEISKREAWKYTGTELFQKHFGEYLPKFKEKFGRKLWAVRFKKWYEEVNDNPNVVVSDVRFPHEVEVLKMMGSVLVKVDRGIESTDDHDSEKHIDELPYEYLIKNDEQLGDLAIKVHGLMSSIN